MVRALHPMPPGMSARTLCSWTGRLSAALLFATICLAGGASAQTCPANLQPLQPTADYDLTLNGGGTVAHAKTGLTWMRCNLGMTWDGSACTGSATPLSWTNALNAAKNETSFGGGWRLPNVSELRSIVESACVSPSVNSAVFPSTMLGNYWTSTTYANDTSVAWNVSFDNGFLNINGKSVTFAVRLVRGGALGGEFDLFATVPDAPTIGAATPGNGQASIAFTPPANNGGSVITSYTATCGVFSNSGTASPIVVTGLTNGSAYTCSVTATNTTGTSVASGTVDVTPVVVLNLVAVQSRKVHGSAGTFDLPIDTGQPIAGSVTVEPRAIGTGHSIVFQFDNPITSPGVATSVDSSGNNFGTPVAAASGNEVVVTLTGIPDNNRAKISISNVNGAGVDAAVSIGFLVGDVNNSRSVSASDISGVRARSLQPIDGTNFKFDLNASGSITAADIAAARARSLLVLP